MIRYPFLIVVDDGGFDNAGEECGPSPITLDHYQRIATLGRRYEVRIPVCFTLKFLDRQGRSKMARPLSYLDDLLDLLRESADAIEVGYHGLVHEHADGGEEFFEISRNRPVPEPVQRSHLELSREILGDCGLAFPEVFVPPYNAWEANVTDRLAAEFGSRYLIAYASMRYAGHRYRWTGSRHLDFLPRTSLGLNGCDVDVHERLTRRLRLVPGRLSIVDFMRRHVVPQPLVWRVRLGRSLRIKPVHSYMTHVGNFSDTALDCWYRLFDDVVTRDDVHLCATTAEATRMYRALATSEGDA